MALWRLYRKQTERPLLKVLLTFTHQQYENNNSLEAHIDPDQSIAAISGPYVCLGQERWLGMLEVSTVLTSQ